MDTLSSCFICSEEMGSFRNDLTVVTGYSEKALFQILEEFTNTALSEEIVQDAGVCQNCFIKFNEYDEHKMLANQIQDEIVLLFESTNNPNSWQNYCIKEEVELPEESKNDYEVFVDAPSENEKNNDQMILYDWVPEDKVSLNETNQKPQFDVNTYAKNSINAPSSTKNQNNFFCEICLRSFKEKSKLKAHKEIHTTLRNVICPTCGKAFKTSACLRSHKRVHNPIYLFCDHCGKSYTQKPEMAKHIKFVHLNIRDFFCQVCGSGFGSKGHLSTHMVTHEDESAKKVKCGVCGSGFYTKAKLDRHMKTHTKERNYECSICGKRFLYSYNVTAHIKHVHYGEKRKESEKFCNLCGKKFQKLWALQEHMAQEHEVIEEEEEGQLYEDYL